MNKVISHTIAALVGAVVVAATLPTKSKTKCARPHCLPYEYRIEVDGTDSIQLYTIRDCNGRIVNECITSGGIDSTIINDNL
jgi:hypothetical protein